MARTLTGPHATAMGVDFARAPGDGSCFFHAIGRQVGLSQQQVRNRFADYYDGIARDAARTEQFLYAGAGREQRNVAGRPIRQPANVPLLGVRAGNVVQNPRVVELEGWHGIEGYEAPANEATATDREWVQSYANSLRRGMYGGNPEIELFSRLFPGVTLRVYTRDGNDVRHTRSEGPRAGVGGYYAECFPPECINILYNGGNHYDYLVRSDAAIAARGAAPARAAAAAPAATRPAPTARPVSRGAPAINLSRMTQANVNQQRALLESFKPPVTGPERQTGENAAIVAERARLRAEYTAQAAGKKNAQGIVDRRIKTWDDKRRDRRTDAIRAAIHATDTLGGKKNPNRPKHKILSEFTDMLKRANDSELMAWFKEASKDLGADEKYLENTWKATLGGGKSRKVRKIRKGRKTTKRHKRR
jgi:hypothetical protein